MVQSVKFYGISCEYNSETGELYSNSFCRYKVITAFVYLHHFKVQLLSPVFKFLGIDFDPRYKLYSIN
jgi:hypothetical protein